MAVASVAPGGVGMRRERGRARVVYLLGTGADRARERDRFAKKAALYEPGGRYAHRPHPAAGAAYWRVRPGSIVTRRPGGIRAAVWPSVATHGRDNVGRYVCKAKLTLKLSSSSDALSLERRRLSAR